MLTFTQQGSVCELICPNCSKRLIATAPSYHGPADDLDWGALLAPGSASVPNVDKPKKPGRVAASSERPITAQRAASRRQPTPSRPFIHRKNNQPIRRTVLLCGLLIGAVSLVAVGIYAGGVLQQSRQTRTGTISAGGWSVTVSPSGTEANVSQPSSVDDRGQAIFNEVTGSKYAISCFEIPPEWAEVRIDEYLSQTMEYEIMRTEHILRKGLQGVKHTARDLKTNATVYHELFSLGESKLLLLTYVSANELEKLGGDKAVFGSAGKTMSIDRPELFFDSLHRVALFAP
jgi:hypothetical protein